MYADQISTGRKRAIHERLDGALPAGRDGAGAGGHTASKRPTSSMTTTLRVYYGAGIIREGLNGVDLSDFPQVTLVLPDDENARMTDVQHWLTQSFSLDPEVCSVVVQGLWSRSSTDIRWELKTLVRSASWKGFVQGCRRRGYECVLLVQPCSLQAAAQARAFAYASGGASSSGGPHVGRADEVACDEGNAVHGGELQPSSYREGTGQADAVHGGELQPSSYREGTGQADEGEHNEYIVQQMESDDQRAWDEERAVEDDEENSSDDEEVPIPQEWNRFNAKDVSAHDGHESPWEYHETEVRLHAMFADKEALQDAVKLWALSMQRTFRVVKSSKEQYTVKCEQAGCPWRVHARRPKYETHWIVSKVEPHSCILNTVLARHRNLTSGFIANLMYEEIVEKKDIAATHIVVAIENKFKYKISYAKAWRAKQKALEKRFGTFEAAYDNLPRMLKVLQQRNPGTYIVVHDKPSISPPGFAVLQRALFAFGASIEAFRHMLPVISVDGTFLTGKYKGQLLTAIGVDGNNQILPLAIAFVESENYESWLWFLRHVRAGVVGTRPGVCVIHDRHAGIIKAIRKLQEDPEESFPWPDMRNRWCSRHLGANFFKQFPKQSLMKLFKRLARQNQQRKFDALWGLLDEHTRKNVEERSKGPVTPGAAQPQCLPAIDEPNPSGPRNIKCFSQWIEGEPLEKWSLLHDTDGARYGIMTTNLAEVYNWVLRGLRSQPLVAIVEGVLHSTIRYFRERHASAALHAANPEALYSSKITAYMETKAQKGQLHTVHVMGNREHRFEVILRDRAEFRTSRSLITHEVCLGDHANESSCTCNKLKLLHKPCSHVLAACGNVHMDPSNFMSKYFFKERILQAWCGELRGFRVVGNFATLDISARTWVPDINMMKGGKGRRQSRRIRNDMDESQAGTSGARCGQCGEEGHTVRRCNACPDQ